MQQGRLTFKVINARKVSFALMAADVAIGVTDDTGNFIGLFVVPDFILKQNDKGYTYQGPSKPYMKNGEHQVDEKTGFKRYLDFFKLYSEKGAGEDPSKYAPTKAAWDARRDLIALLVEAYTQISGGGAQGTSGRAPARSQARTAPARASRPAEAKAVIEDDDVVVNDEDDDLPF